MKKQFLYLTVIICQFLTTCHEGRVSKNENAKLPAHHIVSYCYLAVDKKDSAFLELVTYGKDKVKGHLLIRNSGKPKNTGQFLGQVKDDTLFLIYHFYKGMDSSRRFTNPLAMLKTKDTLVLGTGHILHKLGRSYFDKNVPINFEKGRFQFGQVKCK